MLDERDKAANARKDEKEKEIKIEENLELNKNPLTT
jgi:hypothetical protein